MMLDHRLWRRLALLVCLLFGLSIGIDSVNATPGRSAAAQVSVFIPLVSFSVPPLRIDSASTTSYTDHAGNVWEPDTGFIGGQTGSVPANLSIGNTADPAIYRTERYKLTGYVLPVHNGSYTVRLHFAEHFYTGPGKRNFTVNVEGTPLSNIDVFAESGGLHIALVKSVDVTVSDGQLNLSFTASAGETMIDGIEVIPRQ